MRGEFYYLPADEREPTINVGAGEQLARRATWRNENDFGFLACGIFLKT